MEYTRDWLDLLSFLLKAAADGLPETAQAAGCVLEEIRRRQAEQGAVPLALMAQNCQLGEFAVFCTIMACAGGFDAIFDATFHKLCGSRWPTLGLACRLFGLLEPMAQEELAEAESPDSPCRLLFSLEGEMPHLGRQLRPSPFVHPLLWGEEDITGALPGAELFIPTGMPRGTELHPGHTEQIANFTRRAEADHSGCTVLLSGAVGCGRRQVLQQVAQRLGFALVLVDAARLARLSGTDIKRVAQGVLLQTAALGARVVLCGLAPQDADKPEIGDFLQECGRYSPTVFVLASPAPPAWLRLDESTVEFAFPPDNLLQRRALWQDAAAGYRLEAGLDIHQFANKLHYTWRDVGRVMRRAYVHALARGQAAISAEDVWAGVRLHNAGQLATASLTRVDCVFGWEDIVLPEEPLAAMRNACNRVLHAHTVNDTWGFGKKLPYGRGMAILLYGPPGAGKTMAAQVMAGQLGLELFKVDLSQLVSKYIGDTEKQVGEIFEFATRTNCVLLFDEADSLFSKRTEVKDSNDRHANTETAYLLQKMEEHSGVCVLSTNLLSNMDNAFRRRFTYVIGIPAPDAALRLRIWQKVFPKDAPLALGLSFENLAEKLELSASAIKAVALDAAYLAAADEENIGFAHIAKALRAELQKQGSRMSEEEIALMR